jgi:alkylation response protein AidB-like acyl-CoA dehydrogenase
MHVGSDAESTNRERELVRWASELGATIGQHTERHDREGSFVTEAYDVLRSSGYLALAVPEELGGRGATIRQVAMAQRELARHCASTALASVMHHHVVLFTAWRYRRGLPGAEATLRRVVNDSIVLVSTGGADQTRPRGEAVPVEGGYAVSGRKIFASQSPVGTGIALAGIEVCDVAMDVAGGGAYYKTSPIERCYRDVRGGKFHPLGPEESLVHAGKVALGLPADER